MRCVLHIGTEKTGTTLLQKWFYENEGALSSQGVAITRSSGYPNNRKLAAYFQTPIDQFLKRNGVHNEQDRAAFFKSYDKMFAREIADKRKDHEIFLITSEHFHSRLRTVEEIRKLKTFLDRFFDDYQIVCYFREQSKVRTSLYSTGLKAQITRDITGFQKNVKAKRHYYNYLEFFKKWETVFGKDALLPRLFDKQQFTGGDIRKDFLSHALPGVDPEALNFDIDSANESMSRDQAQVFHAINNSREFYVGRYPDPTLVHLKNHALELDCLKGGGPVTDPRQEEMYDIFNESNVAFFARYFGQEKNLFPRPKTENADKAEQSSLNVSDVAEVYKNILAIQNLVVIEDREIVFLLEFTEKMLAENKISKQEAILLLKLASRACPEDSTLLSMLEDLRGGS